MLLCVGWEKVASAVQGVSRLQSSYARKPSGQRRGAPQRRALPAIPLPFHPACSLSAPLGQEDPTETNNEERRKKKVAAPTRAPDGERKHHGAVRQVVAAVGQARLIRPHAPGHRQQHPALRVSSSMGERAATQSTGRERQGTAGSRARGGHHALPADCTMSPCSRMPTLSSCAACKLRCNVSCAPHRMSVAMSVKEGPRLW